jgi:hypothetical protein
LGNRKQSTRGQAPTVEGEENWDEDLEVTLQKNLINMTGDLIQMPVGSGSNHQRTISKKNFATHQLNQPQIGVPSSNKTSHDLLWE